LSQNINSNILQSEHSEPASLCARVLRNFSHKKTRNKKKEKSKKNEAKEKETFHCSGGSKEIKTPPHHRFPRLRLVQ